MATLKTIRKRIGSVKNTQKITKAMKMVAAAKLRRAQQAVSTVRPYADGLKEMILSLSKGMDKANPFFAEKETHKKLFVLVYTSNRGLCGGFNSSLLRKTETFLRSMAPQFDAMDVVVIGKKGRDFFKARRREVKEVIQEYADNFTPEETVRYAQTMIDGLLAGTYSHYFIAYNQFKSAIAQEVTISQILPIARPIDATGAGAGDAHKALNLVDFHYEPGKEEVLAGLLPKYVAGELYRAHRESLASELGARMTAMESATGNAKEMIKLLTLQYNRLRQAYITKELMDIVNGAESIK